MDLCGHSDIRKGENGWKFIRATSFLTHFTIFYHVNGIFGENQWKQSCSTVKDGPLDQILSVLVKVWGHRTLEKKKNEIYKGIFLAQKAILDLDHAKIDK